MYDNSDLPKSNRRLWHKYTSMSLYNTSETATSSLLWFRTEEKTATEAFLKIRILLGCCRWNWRWIRRTARSVCRIRNQMVLHRGGHYWETWFNYKFADEQQPVRVAFAEWRLLYICTDRQPMETRRTGSMAFRCKHDFSVKANKAQ